MHLLKTIIAFVGFLFEFKKPKFLELEYITLIIDDKPLFFIYWEVKKYYRVKLLNKTHKKPIGSHILQIPTDTVFIDIIVSNFLNKRLIKVNIIHTKLDDVTAALLFKDFKPLQKLIVKTDPVFVKNMISHVKLKKVEISKPAIYTNVEFKLNKKEFNYP